LRAFFTQSGLVIAGTFTGFGMAVIPRAKFEIRRDLPRRLAIAMAILSTYI
jgi:hypothetical protein